MRNAEFSGNFASERGITGSGRTKDEDTVVRIAFRTRHPFVKRLDGRELRRIYVWHSALIVII
jgi:hypothetical protein